MTTRSLFITAANTIIANAGGKERVDSINKAVAILQTVLHSLLDANLHRGSVSLLGHDPVRSAPDISAPDLESTDDQIQDARPRSWFVRQVPRKRHAGSDVQWTSEVILHR